MIKNQNQNQSQSQNSIEQAIMEGEEEEQSLIQLADSQGEDLPERYDDSAFDEVAKSSDYLPRLQLLTSQSDLCKQGEADMNHYAVITNKNTFKQISKEVDVLVIDWRPKALDMGEEVVANFDQKSDEFKRIAAEANEPNSGCQYGPEFLVYVPETKQYATFFMGSKSARNTSAQVKARIGKAATLKSQTIKNKKHTWQVPIAVACSTPFDLPDQEEMKEKWKKFLSPTSSNVETVSKEESEQEERAR